MSAFRNTPLASGLTLLSATALTGCMNLAPAYQRPDAPIPADLPGQPGAAEASGPIVWEDFTVSPDLASVIRLALEENRDLRVAAANVRLARASLGLARSGRLPSFVLTGSATEGDTIDGNKALGGQAFGDSYAVQAGLAAWELDFFGRVANQNQAALLSYLSTTEGERSVKLSIVASVIEAWMQLAADRELLALAEQTVKSQGESLDLTGELLDAGAATELDRRRASASVQAARAQVALYTARVRQDLNTLRLLVGADVPKELTDAATLSPSPVRLRLDGGEASDVLLARPDIQSAEYALQAAYANVGVARAAFFPSISLTGKAGFISTDLGELFGSDGAAGWSFTPSISLPIFDAGARQSRLDTAEAQQDLALATYENTIQAAFRDTANALVFAETIEDQLDALEQLTEDTAVALDLSQERFRGGIDDYLSVLDAQRENYTSQEQLIGVRLEQALNAVALFRALGTWPDEEDTPAEG